VKRLQQRLEAWARRLGCDAEHDAFWRARLAEALTGLAADLRSSHDQPTSTRAAERKVRPRGTTPPAADIPAAPEDLSERQLRTWNRPELDTEYGMSSGELAKFTGWPQSNADRTLRRLAELGHIQLVGDGRPARWRRAAGT
jgi:hypothetical protein